MTTWRFVGEGIIPVLYAVASEVAVMPGLEIVDTIFMWLVAVPLTFLAAYVFKLPPVLGILCHDRTSRKMPVVFIHYFRNKWLTNITRDFE